MRTTGDGFNIGEAARRAGVTPKMARHYESLGLLPEIHRTDSGYRVYTDAEAHTLRFIKRSRDLGFSMAEIAELVKLWQDRRRPSGSVKKLASAHLAELDRKIEELRSMREALSKLIRGCEGGARPECPILDDLGAAACAAPNSARAETAARGGSAKRA